MTALNEALSDADTQEPVKTELQSHHIPESDDDDDVVMIRAKTSDKISHKKPNEQKSTDKASRTVHLITDSDHSDDEHQADPPVDFGEEEEDEEEQATEKSKEGTTAQPKDPDLMDFEDEDKVADKSSKADQGERKETGKKKKGAGASQSPKKTKKAKTKELSPSKTIKKSKVDLKSKSKVAKGKQTASKKATQAGKTKEKPSNPSKPSIPEPAAKATKEEQPSKNSAKNKPLVRKAVKAPPKGEKASSAKQKPLKVKKAINKEEVAKEKKSPVKKSTKTVTPVTTYSKKAKKVGRQPSKSVAKEKKKSGEDVVAPKKPAGKKVAKKSKAAKKKQDEEKEESETTGHVDDESESGEPVSDSDSMGDELARTPSSKLAILGNLACSSRDQNAEALLDHAVQQLGRYHIVSYNAESNTGLTAYIIGKGTKRGWGLLQALVSGVPLVSENWLSGSISEGKWVPMNAFRSDRFGQSPRSVAGAEEARGKLLDGLRIRVVSTEKDASSIRKIIRLCGARLAETRVDLVINDSKRKVDTCPNVQKKWLADSIEAGVPLEYEPYSLG